MSGQIADTPHPTPDTHPQGERRQLTVLFCDLVGSTPLSQQLNAEEWRDLIAQYQQAAPAPLWASAATSPRTSAMACSSTLAGRRPRG